jgi:hypothetical protein
MYLLHMQQAQPDMFLWQVRVNSTQEAHQPMLHNASSNLTNPLLDCLQVVALCEALRKSSPTRLVLSYNELGNTAAKAVAQLMQPYVEYDDAPETNEGSSSSSKQGLLELELSSNQITAEGAAALADALAQPECTLQVGRRCTACHAVQWMTMMG